ncbi:MAG: tetratricopeptide repeat protein [Rickettsiaceae bacterium]|nr:tetratricopeptide repeat protein [Rickettsiaceae bacterium]
MALSSRHNDIETMFNKAGVLYLLEKYEEAIESFEKIININYNHFDTHKLRDSALFALDRADEVMYSLLGSIRY